MATSKLSETYRGFGIVEVVDAQGHVTWKVKVAGFDLVFTSLESARAAIDTHLNKEQSAPELDPEPKPEPEPEPPPRIRPSP